MAMRREEKLKRKFEQKMQELEGRESLDQVQDRGQPLLNNEAQDPAIHSESTSDGEIENDHCTPEEMIKTKTRVMLADLPVSMNDIQNAILDLATQINLDNQQK